MTQQKLHVAFDMDDTLCSLVGPSMELARKVLGVNLRLPRYGEYVGWFPGQLSEEQRQELLSHIYKPDFYLALPTNFSTLHNMSLERVSRVAREHYDDVKIITARGGALGAAAEDVTREWLRINAFVGWADVAIHVHEHGTHKSSFCGTDPTVMVDDSLIVAEDFAACEHHRVLMIDQSWNSGHPRNRNIRRVASRKLCEALIQQAADLRVVEEPDW